jgi:hypothetical protein
VHAALFSELGTGLRRGDSIVESSMEHASGEHGHDHGYESLNRSAVRATLHEPVT